MHSHIWVKGSTDALLKQVGVVVREEERLWIVTHILSRPRRVLQQLRPMFLLLASYSGTSGGGGGGNDSLIKGTMVDLLERLPDNFEMITMQLRAKPLLEGEAGPFVVVALQVNAT